MTFFAYLTTTFFSEAERVVEEGEYELPPDIYDTQGLFDDDIEGKQDNSGLLETNSSSASM